ncbi:hypothetical protein PM082_014560 [Marasmius tenuissimus]|nr:hypothetical protein PM082_014560 [Marasmius tenuissimus]
MPMKRYSKAAPSYGSQQAVWGRNQTICLGRNRAYVGTYLHEPVPITPPTPLIFQLEPRGTTAASCALGTSKPTKPVSLLAGSRSQYPANGIALTRNPRNPSISPKHC